MMVLKYSEGGPIRGTRDSVLGGYNEGGPTRGAGGSALGGYSEGGPTRGAGGSVLGGYSVKLVNSKKNEEKPSVFKSSTVPFRGSGKVAGMKP